MAITDPIAGRPSRRAVLIGAVAVTAVLIGVGLWLWNRSPQMGPDREVFMTVDALFTAVTARDEKLLADCERRLQALRDGGRLPAPAATYLDGIIRTARAGSWQTAAERLYDFMRAQRRESLPRSLPAG